MDDLIKIKTITPIWTGDIDLKSDILQPMGIMGSLRWWFEVILRSMDGYFICDPTGNGCPKEKNGKKYYCPACLIFGATGLRRTFRLDINGGKSAFVGNTICIKPSERNRGWYLGSGIVDEIDLKITPLDRVFDKNLILIPLIIALKWGGIGAKVQHGYGVGVLKDNKNYQEADFKRFKEAIKNIIDQKRLSKLNISLRYEDNKGFPTLNEMFFAKVQFEVTGENWWKNVDGIKQALEPKDRSGNIRKGLQEKNKRILNSWFATGSVPISPAIKNWLRYKDGKRLWETANHNLNVKIENWLFGTISKFCTVCHKSVKKDKRNSRRFWCSNCHRSLKKEETYEERISSKINISCAYPIDNHLYEFRIWGWIPNNKDNNRLYWGFKKNDFLNNLKNVLIGRGSVTIPWNELLGDQTINYKLRIWREFNSIRDSIKNNYSNIYEYIYSLLRD